MDELLQRRVAQELDCTQRIVELGARLHPRFRILTAEGYFHVIRPQLHTDEAEWNRLVSAYMAYKLASAFVVSWSRGPNDTATIGVSRSSMTGYACPIDWSTRSLGPRVSLGKCDCKIVYSQMLPEPHSSLDEETYTLMLKRFGPFDPRPRSARH